MDFKNNLLKLIQDCKKVEFAMPEKAVLKKAGINKTRYGRLIRNEVKMNAWEALVLCEWLETSLTNMVSPLKNKKSDGNLQNQQ